MIVRLQGFNRKAWVSRLGNALEQIAADAHPSGVPLGILRPLTEDRYRGDEHHRYREMAAMARTEPFAAKLFERSFLWLDTLPDGVQDLLLEHPVFEQSVVWWIE